MQKDSYRLLIQAVTGHWRKRMRKRKRYESEFLDIMRETLSVGHQKMKNCFSLHINVTVRQTTHWPVHYETDIITKSWGLFFFISSKHDKSEAEWGPECSCMTVDTWDVYIDIVTKKWKTCCFSFHCIFWVARSNLGKQSWQSM